jgi:F-type H+-transporting ATPase subunit a
MEAVIPQVVFYLFGLPITNTVVSTWVMMVLIIALVLIIKKVKPAALEMLIELINGIVSNVMPENTRITKFLPLLGSLMIFLLFANIFSIFPLMVSPTANINTPLALAIVVFFGVHIYGVAEKGVWGYIKDFASPIFILPLEIVNQFSRTLSLTLRLFGNILSTDLIVAIVFSLVPFLVPLPLAGLGMLTGILQAYIFTTLASLYVASAIEVSEEEQERKRLKKEIRQLS